MAQRTGHNKIGSTLALGLLLAFFLVILGIGFFCFSLYFGGARETKNAVDAGALNVGRKVLTINVSLSGDPTQQFYRDVTDSNGNINLTNINRVWGKALMVAINVDAATQLGNAGNASTSADSAFQGAHDISDNLCQQLTTPSNLYGFFNDYANQNSTRMLGVGSKVEATPNANWQTSLMDRNAESNIQVTDNLPVGYTLNSSFTTGSTRNPVPSKAVGLNYLVGYRPLTLLNHDFWQVPFKFEEKPHLLASSSFHSNQQPPNNLPKSWPLAVPNGYSVDGHTVNTGNSLPESAQSWVQTNPQQVFPLQIPHGFIRVRLKQNTLQWCPDGIPANESNYNFSPDSSDSIPYVIGCGAMRGTAYTGNEYLPPTLYKAICAVPPIGGNAMDYLLQRVKEMDPTYDMGKLTGILNLCFIDTGSDEQEFFIYPNKFTGDIIATSASSSQLPSDCDGSQSPEGTDQTLDTEGPFPFPNFGTEEFDCYGSYTWPTLVLLNGTRSWKPGSGYQGGCLGELTIERKTQIYLFGICPCPI